MSVAGLLPGRTTAKSLLFSVRSGGSGTGSPKPWRRENWAGRQSPYPAPHPLQPDTWGWETTAEIKHHRSHPCS